MTVSIGRPTGEPYDWFRRACDLLAHGNSEAAANLLEHVRDVDDSATVLEVLARARYECRDYEAARDVLLVLVRKSPDSDYAHFLLGLCLWRLQDFPGARDHLSLSFVMHPGRSQCASALGQVKATLRARIAANLPLQGPISGFDE